MKKLVLVTAIVIAAALALHRRSEQKDLVKVVSLTTATSTEKEAQVRKPFATETVAKASDAVVTQAEASRPPLETVANLSQKIFLSDSDKNAMKEALLNKETLQRISEGLNNHEMLKPSEFKNRMKLVDAVYEGLKSQDGHVHATYMKLTAQILNQEMSSQISANKKMREQFLGDRVEIALAMSKLPGFATNQRWIQGQSPAAQKYFKRADQISGLYEVSL